MQTYHVSAGLLVVVLTAGCVGDDVTRVPFAAVALFTETVEVESVVVIPLTLVMVCDELNGAPVELLLLLVWVAFDGVDVVVHMLLFEFG